MWLIKTEKLMDINSCFHCGLDVVKEDEIIFDMSQINIEKIEALLKIRAFDQSTMAVQ